MEIKINHGNKYVTTKVRLIGPHTPYHYMNEKGKKKKNETLNPASFGRLDPKPLKTPSLASLWSLFALSPLSSLYILS
jgi:hypothetical protein